MTTAFVADVHVGNFRKHGGPVTSSINERCRMVLNVLKAAVETALKRECQRFVIAGDLLDYSRPEAPILREVQEICRAGYKGKMEIIVLVGNHDQVSTGKGDHALGVLSTYAIVVEKPRVLPLGNDALLCVPFQPGAAKDWLPCAVRAMLNAEGAGGPRSSPPTAGRRTLAIHLGVRDERTPPWLRDSPDAIDVADLFAICREHDITRVIAGNWHDHRMWSKPSGVEVVQLGALCPTGWDNPGLDGYGTLGLLHDDDRFERLEISGPRFVSTKTEEDAAVFMKRAKKGKHQLFLTLEVAPENLAGATAWVAAETARGSLAGGEALPDETVAKHEAKNAAVAASSAATVTDALTDFVEHKPMAEGVDRARVLERCREYLKT